MVEREREKVVEREREEERGEWRKEGGKREREGKI